MNDNRSSPVVVKYDDNSIKMAEQVLIDNGIDKDDAQVVLQAIGYVLFDIELY